MEDVKTEIYLHPNKRFAIPADAGCGFYPQAKFSEEGFLLPGSTKPCMKPASALLVTARTRIARYMCEEHAQECLKLTKMYELVTTQKLVK